MGLQTKYADHHYVLRFSFYVLRAAPRPLNHLLHLLRVAHIEEAEDVAWGVGPHILVAGPGTVALALSGLEHDVAHIGAAHLDDGMRQAEEAVGGKGGIQYAVAYEHPAIRDQVLGLLPLAIG